MQLIQFTITPGGDGPNQCTFAGTVIADNGNGLTSSESTGASQSGIKLAFQHFIEKARDFLNAQGG